MCAEMNAKVNFWACSIAMSKNLMTNSLGYNIMMDDDLLRMVWGRMRLQTNIMISNIIITQKGSFIRPGNLKAVQPKIYEILRNIIWTRLTRLEVT